MRRQMRRFQMRFTESWNESDDTKSLRPNAGGAFASPRSRELFYVADPAWAASHAMSKKRVIVAAVGQKGVTYGVSSHGDGTNMPRQLLELVATSKADSWTLTRGGAVASFSACHRSFRLLEHFVERAEALRDSMPNVGIGIAEGRLNRQFDWFGLKRDFRIDPNAEQRALANVQNDQTYRQVFDELRAA